MAQAQTAAATTKSAPSRRTLRTAGRKKRMAKLNSDPEFKKKYFDGKSKRSIEKKAAFRKKKKHKK